MRMGKKRKEEKRKGKDEHVVRVPSLKATEVKLQAYFLVLSFLDADFKQ